MWAACGEVWFGEDCGSIVIAPFAIAKWVRNPVAQSVLEHYTLYGGEQVMCGPIATKAGLDKMVEALS